MTKREALSTNDNGVGEGADRIRMYVIFAHDLNEQEQWTNRRPVDFCEAADLGGTLLLLGEEYGHNVLLEPVKDGAVTGEDWERLKSLQLSVSETSPDRDEWEELICVPASECRACGGAGVLVSSCLPDYFGDCDRCLGSGHDE